MKQKEKEYLISFKLYIEHYDPRYRYPKWIKAVNKTDAITKYMAIIKPDPAIGACIVMDERPIQDETQETGEANLLEKFFDVYRKGNLRLLEMMISQLNNLIDPTKPNHAPRQSIFDMDEINETLCSTSKLVYMLSSGFGHDMLPYNGYIYTDDFLEHVNDYMDTRYKYEFYDDYTLMRIRDDLQCIYNDYNRRGILSWETKKLEDAVCGASEVMNVSDFQAVVNREESKEDKTPAIKIIKQRTDEEEDNMNNSEPSKMKKYQLATENISESTPRLYNLHIVEGYDLTSAIKDYNKIYVIDDAREQVVVIRELDDSSAIGAMIAPGVRSRLDRMKHNAEEETETLQEEDVEEMKASVVKGDRRNTTERTPLEILEHEPIFDIEAMGLDKGYAYLLETINDDGSVERKVIVIIDISEKCINYIWRETASDTIRREGSLSPRPFEEGRYKLYPITAEDLK